MTPIFVTLLITFQTATLGLEQIFGTKIHVTVSMQFITFGFAAMPLYFVWEKALGVHKSKSMLFRALCRIPVVLPIWFLAIIFPFFGPINSAVGALLVTFTVYIIPSAAHMAVYRSAYARMVSTRYPSS
jgi:auxin influx carrier (AUX1 LAX family)